jgi:hypothetical protein
MNGTCSTNGDEKYIQSLVENLKGRGHLEDTDIDGRIIFKWILQKESGQLHSEFIWIRIGTGGELL